MAADIMPQRRAFMIMSMRIASMLIIDVRRTDYEGGAIRGSINIPAQGFWWNRGMLYELAYKAGMEWVVFTCGDSSGRGPRCAGWFLDHVRNTVQDQDMQVLVLEGGVKGWVKGGREYWQYMVSTQGWNASVYKTSADRPLFCLAGWLPRGALERSVRARRCCGECE